MRKEILMTMKEYADFRMEQALRRRKTFKPEYRGWMLKRNIMGKVGGTVVRIKKEVCSHG